jgi:small conductance mechanosensitive channel
VTIRSNSGRTVFVPNSMVLDREIVNLVRHGTRRTTLVVGVAYGTDLTRAREVILEAASGAQGVLAEPPVRVMCSEFADSSVNFDLDFWHGPAETERRETAGNVVIEVHRSLAEAGITIPFPQRTVWYGEES